MMRRCGLALLAAAALACGDATAPPASGEPIELSADWIRAAPAAEGFDPAALTSALDAAGAVEGLRSLLVVRFGRLVVERYFGGSSPDSLYALRSVTKSVMSLLVGGAIASGSIRSVDQPLAELFGPPLPALNAAQGAITVRNLLTMSAGFEWNELGDVSEYNDWVLARDQLDYLLARPLIAPPGTTFSYNSAAVHLLSAVLQEHAGGTAAFADARLLGPLGITQRDWEVDDRGIPNGGAGLYLRPLDMAKLGQLVLQRGRSGSKEVIPTAWIDESIRAHIVPHSSVPGLGDLGYGYLWWLGRSGGHDAAFAWGYGGQFIYIVPDLDLVVVTTATWQGLGTGQAAQAESILAFIATRIAPTAL